jgi:hypothetical protein
LRTQFAEKKTHYTKKQVLKLRGKHFDLDILMGGDNMKFWQLVLGLGGSIF